MKEQLQDKTQRAVLRALGQLRAGQTKSVSGFGKNVQGWKDAAEELVKQGLAIEIMGEVERSFAITRSGRYLLRQERHGAEGAKM